jgi:predicted nucleic acid-binding protein
VVIFLDTSFLYAVAIKGDKHHERAKKLFSRALDEKAELVIHNLILVETVALIQRRHGHATAAGFIREADSFRTIMIDKDLHDQVLGRFVSSGARRVSLVDMFSFALMRRERIKYALAFDDDFIKEGFSLFGDED